MLWDIRTLSGTCPASLENPQVRVVAPSTLTHRFPASEMSQLQHIPQPNDEDKMPDRAFMERMLSSYMESSHGKKEQG